MELLDLHVHGALGANFGDDEAASRRAVAHHRARGTAALVASLVTAAADTLVDQVRTLAPLIADGTIAGIHLEGPFLSDARRGAHDPALLRPPDPDLVDRLVAAASESEAERPIVHWTYAPELPGADAFVRRLVAHRIQPAIGHTDADAQTVRQQIDAIGDALGRPALITHFGNGMPPFHQRRGGAFAVALTAAARGEAILELIADGVHLDDDVVRMVFESIDADCIALVSDGTPATGQADGSTRLGSLDVEIRGGLAWLAGTETIAGSTTTLGELVTRCVERIGLDPVAVATAATATPRRILAVPG